MHIYIWSWPQAPHHPRPPPKEEGRCLGGLEILAFAACLGICMTEAEVADFVQCEASVFMAHQGLQQRKGKSKGDIEMPDANKGKGRVCYECGSPDHYARDCPIRQARIAAGGPAILPEHMHKGKGGKGGKGSKGGKQPNAPTPTPTQPWSTQSAWKKICTQVHHLLNGRTGTQELIPGREVQTFWNNYSPQAMHSV